MGEVLGKSWKTENLQGLLQVDTRTDEELLLAERFLSKRLSRKIEKSKKEFKDKDEFE